MVSSAGDSKVRCTFATVTRAPYTPGYPGRDYGMGSGSLSPPHGAHPGQVLHGCRPVPGRKLLLLRAGPGAAEIPSGFLDSPGNILRRRAVAAVLPDHGVREMIAGDRVR